MSPFRLNLSPTEPRECTSCGKFLAARHFPKPITQPSGYVSVLRCCRPCVNARRRQGPGYASRPAKRNAAGLYHCYACHAYLPADSFARSKGKPYAYCRPCARMNDAISRRKINADPERRRQSLAAQRARTLAWRKRQQHRRQQQVEFAHDALLLLRKRGLTKAQICVLGKFSHLTLDRWEQRRTQWCRVQATDRLLALLRATAFLPVGDTYPERTTKRHPEWDRIVEELRWEMGDLAQ